VSTQLRFGFPKSILLFIHYYYFLSRAGVPADLAEEAEKELLESTEGVSAVEARRAYLLAIAKKDMCHAPGEKYGDL